MTFERITVESVHVTAPSSKSRRNRYVETNETFWRWASPHLNGEGPILKPNFQKRHKQVVQSAGVKLPVDVLRHCFGSYWLAVHHDAARLAHLMGNSETVIFAHYRRIIPRPQAERYWALAP
jgi:site-specific recombinase XerD